MSLLSKNHTTLGLLFIHKAAHVEFTMAVVVAKGSDTGVRNVWLPVKIIRVPIQIRYMQSINVCLAHGQGHPDS
jgi:hypothetical protein